MLRFGLPKVQWPSADICPSCRSAMGEWRLREVIRFLSSAYCLDPSKCALGRNSSTEEPEAAPSWRLALNEGVRDLEFNPWKFVTLAVLLVAALCLSSCGNPRHRWVRHEGRKFSCVNHVQQSHLLHSDESDD